MGINQPYVAEANTKGSQRVFYLDIMRVISIFAMMMLHVSAGGFNGVGFTTTTWMACNVYDSLVRFCVPLLIMISGAIYLNPSRSVTVKSMVTKAIPRMAIAFVIWSTLYGLFEFFVLGNIFTRRALAEAILLGHYHLWFLFTISGLYLATPILRCIAARADLTKYFLVCAVLFCFIPFFLLNTDTWVGDTLYAMLGKANLDTFWGYTGYFLLGHFLHQREFSKKQRWIIYLLGIAGVVFTVVATYQTSLAVGYGDARWYSYFLPTVGVTAMAIFVFCKAHCSLKGWSPAGKRRLVTLSTLSFGMYLLHIFWLTIVKYWGLNVVDYPALIAVPVSTVIIFGLSFVTTYILSKIPIIKISVR